MPAPRSSPAAWPSAIATSCRREIPGDRRRARHRRSARDRRARSAARRRAASPLTFYRAGGPRTSRRRRPPSTEPALPSTRVREHLPTYIYDADTPRLLATPRHYAYVKIAEGCDYKCAFCIIPTLRGALSQPAGRVDRPRSAGAGRARRQGTAAHLAGHDVLRHRPPRARRARAAAARAERRSTASSGSGCSTSIRRRSTTTTLAAMAECDKVCKYIDLPLQHASNPVLKRMKRPGTRQSYDALLDRIRDARARRRAPHHVHRRLPGRDRRGRRGAVRVRRPTTRSTTSACSPTRTRKARRRYALDDDVPARVKTARRDRVMSLQKRLVRRRQQRADRRARRGSWSTARRPSTSWSCKGRLATQAPDIDAVGLPDRVRPVDATAPGDFAESKSSARADYDLIARPRRRCAVDGPCRDIISDSEPGCRTEVGVCPLFSFRGL